MVKNHYFFLNYNQDIVYGKSTISRCCVKYKIHKKKLKFLKKNAFDFIYVNGYTKGRSKVVDINKCA